MNDLIEISEAIASAIARGDAATLQNFLHPGFTYLDAGGKQSREAFLQAISSATYRILSIRLENLVIEEDVDAGLAIVTGVQHARVELAEGQQVDSRGAFTDVFVKQGDAWILRAATSTELPAEA